MCENKRIYESPGEITMNPFCYMPDGVRFLFRFFSFLTCVFLQIIYNEYDTDIMPICRKELYYA